MVLLSVSRAGHQWQILQLAMNSLTNRIDLVNRAPLPRKRGRTVRRGMFLKRRSKTQRLVTCYWFFACQSLGFYGVNFLKTFWMCSNLWVVRFIPICKEPTLQIVFFFSLHIIWSTCCWFWFGAENVEKVKKKKIKSHHLMFYDFHACPSALSNG